MWSKANAIIEARNKGREGKGKGDAENADLYRELLGTYTKGNKGNHAWEQESARKRRG